MDLALQTSVLGVKTLHSTAGGCARNDCRCACAGETLSANRFNERFQSRLRSLYNLWCRLA